MKLLICIDDTDSKTSEKGTGAIAEDIRTMIQSDCGGTCSQITRHQLLLHPDIPYTSHNSSMCFGAEIPDDAYDGLLADAVQLVKAESAPGSDPGLAVAECGCFDPAPVIAFGKECKRRVVKKEDALETARKAGFYLAELGGTGDGIIGAAAGIGLRTWGFDGTVKGRAKDIKTEKIISVGCVLQSRSVDRVISMEGADLPPEAQILLPEKTKIALYDGAFCIMAEERADGVWQVPERGRMKQLGGDRILEEGCDDFAPDVEEEQVEAGRHSCYNCRYRRWLDTGIVCQRP